MQKTVAVVVLAVLVVLGCTRPAGAAIEPSQLAASDVVVEPGASLPPGDVERLEGAARRLRAGGTPTKFAVVAARPAEGAPQAARDLRRAIRFSGTLLLLVPAGSLGIASGRSEAAIGQAFEASRAQLRADPVGGTIAVAERLAGSSSGALPPEALAPEGAPEPQEPAGSGVSGLVLVALVVAGFAGFLAFTRRAARKRAEADLADRQAALEPLIDALAAHITELGSDLRLGGDKAAPAQPHYDEAVLAYGEVRDAMPSARTAPAVESARVTLERGLRAAQSARAVLEGRPLPPPEETALLDGLCAFDPKHGRAVRTMPVVTPAGDQAELPVCSRCAAGLEAGEMPEPRRVYQHGAPVPYWQGLGSMGYGPSLFPMFGGFLGGMVLHDLFTPDVTVVDPGGEWGGGWGGGDWGGGDWGGGDFGGDFGGGDF